MFTLHGHALQRKWKCMAGGRGWCVWPWGNHVGPHGKSLGPPKAITWAPRGNHVDPQGKSRGPPWVITWAPMGNHVGPQGKSRGTPGEITCSPWGNHVGPQGKSRVGKEWKQCQTLFSGGSKITADGDYTMKLKHTCLV